MVHFDVYLKILGTLQDVKISAHVSNYNLKTLH